MDTILNFKILVLIFLFFCVYEFFLKEFYQILKRSVFIKFSLITVVFCCVQGLMFFFK